MQLRSPALEGDVLISGSCPVLSTDAPCPPEPFAATIVLEPHDGSTPTELSVGPSGHFRLLLEPGQYRLVPEQPIPGAPPFAEPQEVTVRLGESTMVTIVYDGGVRGAGLRSVASSGIFQTVRQ